MSHSTSTPPSPGPRLSTPLVLAIASGMVCVGLLGLWWNRGERAPAHARDELGVLVDASSPERAAESFLDAWRKRAHDVAAELSEGDAHEAVLARRRRDDALSEADRAIKRQLWDSMARDRLQLRLDESERVDEGGLALRGVAEGRFLDRPYARRLTMVLVEREGSWKVRSFDFGEILTELPAGLRDD